MKTLLLILIAWMLASPPGMASPLTFGVTRQRAVIEKIQPPDRKENTAGYIEVRGLDRSGQRTKQAYVISFYDADPIDALSRSKGALVIKFGDLRVGQELVFSGTADAIWASPRRCVVYLP